MVAPVRVLLVDDHEIVRLGLMTLIDDQDDMQVVGEAGTASQALDMVARLQPDVVLMDIRLPDNSGIEATRQITSQFPHVRVVILTSFSNDNLVIDAIRAGAAGYILKQVGNDELLRAISAAARDESFLDSGSAARLIAHVRALDKKSQEDAFRELSSREMDVLVELTRGKTNSEIGKVLHLQETTVRNYVSNIMRKLNIPNRIELAIFAVQNHIFERSVSE